LGKFLSPCEIFLVATFSRHRNDADALGQGAPCFRRLRGFSVVEILVVLALIVVVMAILLPAVSGARESARRAACSANQVRLAMGISRFHVAKEYLPGAKQGSTTWFATIRPYLSRTESEAVCPSGMKKTTISNWLTYGINAGAYFAGVASPRIHDGAVIDNSGTARKSFDDIRLRDGLSNTWLTGDSMSHKNGTNDVGHSWSATGNNTGILGFRTAAARRINEWGNPPGTSPPDPSTVPPRSIHPGGVVVTFCDGQSRFIKDDIPIHVYAHLTTSHSVWTGTQYDQAINSDRAITWLTEGSPAEQEPVRVKAGIDY
jgi:type II secretory pathway pseudopilin PulG